MPELKQPSYLTRPAALSNSRRDNRIGGRDALLGRLSRRYVGGHAAARELQTDPVFVCDAPLLEAAAQTIGGRYWDRTSGPCRVKAVLYR